MRYRKKPVEVEAILWAGPGWGTGAVIAFCGTHRDSDGGELANFVPLGYPEPTLWVAANNAYVPLQPPEWIIRDSLGLYPCKPAIFDQTYEPA